MALLETEALVLRTYNFGEADKIVVCLTRSAGLIRAVAKGCRKLKSKFGASLEPFTLARIHYYQKENQELVSLNQAEILKSHFDLSGNAEILTGLAYMGDLSEPGKAIRGILVASDFSPRAVAAARITPNIKLVKYTFRLLFEDVKQPT